MARTGPAGERVQLRLETPYTSEGYVSERGWLSASLQRCPFHPRGGCGLVGHGSYGRVWPVGTRVARFFCPKARRTISLLPDFLACRLTGTLAELESAVEAADRAESLEAAAEEVRPSEAVGAVTLPSALRWLRRRLVPVRAALLAAVTLVTELSECKPTVAAIRERLGVRFALEALRSVAARHLSAMTAPVGLRARVRRPGGSRRWIPHEVGPDPPRGRG